MDTQTKKPAPNPLRWRESCPDCGYVLSEISAELRGSGPFDCPRCGAHYSAEDYRDEMHEKHMAQHHRHARADLSQEADR